MKQSGKLGVSGFFNREAKLQLLLILLPIVAAFVAAFFAPWIFRH
jgi:hypothetical protein